MRFSDIKSSASFLIWCLPLRVKVPASHETAESETGFGQDSTNRMHPCLLMYRALGLWSGTGVIYYLSNFLPSNTTRVTEINIQWVKISFNSLRNDDCMFQQCEVYSFGTLAPTIFQCLSASRNTASVTLTLAQNIGLSSTKSDRIDMSWCENRYTWR